MAIAVDPRETFPYVLKQDRDAPEADQTTFELSALTERDERRLIGKAAEDTLTFAYECLGLALKGWSNLQGEAGEQVEYTPGKKGGASDAALDLLHSSWRIELAFVVLQRGQLTDAEGN